MLILLSNFLEAGMIKAAPNQPADKFTNKSESTEYKAAFVTNCIVQYALVSL